MTIEAPTKRLPEAHELGPPAPAETAPPQVWCLPPARSESKQRQGFFPICGPGRSWAPLHNRSRLVFVLPPHVCTAIDTAKPARPTTALAGAGE
jgi:hypothetical protein